MRLLAQGQSNREIAQVLVIALETVKWYNKQIYDKLGVHSREKAVVKARLLGLLQTQPADFRHNLPSQISSFVGRKREINSIDQLLVDNRLLTLSGPPGTGKTRLALEIASRNLDRFQDGVFFVDLAAINNPQLVPNTITQTLDIKEAPGKSLMDTLTHHIRYKQMLLVIDNFEQVIVAAPLVNDLLSACPGLKILVTSREPMRVYDEDGHDRLIG